ncbi:MAG: hypothetical protein ACOYN4_08810 [Bacteroidales bacterium]
MEIEDFFENKRKHGEHDRYKSPHHENESYHGHSQHDHHGYDHDTHHGNNRHGQDYHTMLQPLLAKLKSNPLLKFAIITGGIVVLILAVLIIVAVFPLLLNLLETFSKSGFQEILKIFTK